MGHVYIRVCVSTKAQEYKKERSKNVKTIHHTELVKYFILYTVPLMCYS